MYFFFIFKYYAQKLLSFIPRFFNNCAFNKILANNLEASKLAFAGNRDNNRSAGGRSLISQRTARNFMRFISSAPSSECSECARDSSSFSR